MLRCCCAENMSLLFMVACAGSHPPTDPSLSNTLPKCWTLPDTNQLHARFINAGLLRSTPAAAGLILRLCSSPDPPLRLLARRIFFSSIPIHSRDNPFLWYAIIKSSTDPPAAALSLVLMLATGITANRFSVSLVLKASYEDPSLPIGLQVHDVVLNFFTLLAKGALSDAVSSEQESPDSELEINHTTRALLKENNVTYKTRGKQLVDLGMKQMSIPTNLDGHKAAQNILVELADCVVDCHADVQYSQPIQVRQAMVPHALSDPRYSIKLHQSATLCSTTDSNLNRESCSYVEIRNCNEANKMSSSQFAMEGPSGDSSCYKINNSIWSSVDHQSKFSVSPSNNGASPSDWGRSNLPSLWGGRTVGRRQVKSAKVNCGVRSEECCVLEYLRR